MCDAGIETVVSTQGSSTAERPSPAEALRLTAAFFRIKDVARRAEVVALAERFAEQP